MLPNVSISFRCDDAAVQRVFDEAERKCRLNLQDFAGDRVLVEGGGYEKIWLETQPMGGEMYALRDLEAARNNSLLFMRHQRADGRLPGSIQRVGGAVEPQFNKLQGFCFAEPALNLYWLLGRDADWLDALADCLRRFDEYLWRTRAVSGDGLLSSFCVYDTGEDNAVRYGDAPCWWSDDAPPTDSAVVPMASMDVTSYSYACRDALARISRLRGCESDERRWRAAADEVAAALRRRLWDGARGALFDRDRHGNPVDVLCHNTLRCMYWGSISPDMADRFVREHLVNPREFWTALPLPSVSVSDPAFRNAPENNWSGQCEGLTYQRAITALERYGHDALVVTLGHKLLRAIAEGGYAFTQQYDPFTGAPSRVGMISHRPLPPGSDEPFQDAYGPTLLSALGYIERMWGIGLRAGEVRFSLCGGPACRCEARWNGHEYALESDGQRAVAIADGRRVYEGPCGARIITDESGALLRTHPLQPPQPCESEEWRVESGDIDSSTQTSYS